MRKSAGLRRYRWQGAIAGWAAVLLQLHLFFVVEIHNHKADSICGAMPSQLATIQPQPPANSPSVAQFCAACQIARQGLVGPPRNTLAALRLPEFNSRPQHVNLFPFSGFRFRLTGRSPPRFS